MASHVNHAKVRLPLTELNMSGDAACGYSSVALVDIGPDRRLTLSGRPASLTDDSACVTNAGCGHGHPPALELSNRAREKPMTTCNVCSGTGSLATGRYESCYGCGGRGYGSSIDQACTACGGSGNSTREVRDVCFQCCGGGIVDDPTPPSTARSATRRSPSPAKSATKAPTASSGKTGKASSGRTDPSGTIGTIAVVAAIIAGVAAFSGGQPAPEAVGMALAVLIATNIVMFVAYHLLRITFFTLLAVAAGNILGFDWARELVRTLLG